jgi:hypothetical protein
MTRTRWRRALALMWTTATLAMLTVGVDASGAQGASAAAPTDVAQLEAAQQSRSITYGPFSLPAAPTNPDGTHGHYHTGNQFLLGAEKPCSNCYITGMKANLVDTSGNVVGIHDNLMLHHMVLFNAGDGRTDATCGLSFLGFLGQRFFAAGDERTPIEAQPGYGYRVGNGSFNMIYELMTMATTPTNVAIEMDWTWIPAAEAEASGITDIEPVWFDIDQCGDSEVAMPAGPSTRSWTWNVNRPGDIIGIGGHLHGGGINVEIKNDSTGELICDSVAGYGETPMYIDHHGNEWLSSMSTCGGASEPGFASPVSNGQRVTMTGHYDMPEAVDDQMGIVIAYVAEDDEADECAPWDWICWIFGPR